jgi:hypothetical protein
VIAEQGNMPNIIITVWKINWTLSLQLHLVHEGHLKAQSAIQAPY